MNEKTLAILVKSYYIIGMVITVGSLFTSRATPALAFAAVLFTFLTLFSLLSVDKTPRRPK